MTLSNYKCYNHKWMNHNWKDLGESIYVWKGVRYHEFVCLDCKAIAFSAPNNTLNEGKEQ